MCFFALDHIYSLHWFICISDMGRAPCHMGLFIYDMCRDIGLCTWSVNGCSRAVLSKLNVWELNSMHWPCQPPPPSTSSVVYVKNAHAAQCRLFLRMSCLCIAWDEEWDRLGVRCTLRALGLLAYSVDIITRGWPLRQVCLTIVNICEGYSTAWLICNLVKIIIIFNKLQPDY